MARDIKIRTNTLTSIVKAIKDAKFVDDQVSIRLPKEKAWHHRIQLVFTPKAFSQMELLVNSFDSEVAWHGLVERTGTYTFEIKEILIYPQQVTGATVNTDQVEYQNWLYSLSDEQFNSLRFQGHSHVFMSTGPSSVDLSHQQKIVDQLGDNDFYIFAIWNKRDQYTIRIFDMVTNTMYDNDDIDLYISDELNMEEFLRNAHDMVRQKKSDYVAKVYGSIEELNEESMEDCYGFDEEL